MGQHGLVRKLPSSPSPGDTCEVQPAKGIVWRLIYDGMGVFGWRKT